MKAEIGNPVSLRESSIKVWLRRLGLVLASSLHFAVVTLLIFFWELELPLYVFMVLFISLAIGIVSVEIERALFYTISGVIIGTSLALTIFFAPYYMFGESMQAANIASLVVFSIIAKHFLIGISFYLVGALSGCIIGENITKHGEM